VLGLRDVMDAPEKLKAEWAPHDVMDHVSELYDDIWVYGPKDFWDPLTGLDVPASVRARMTYLGFLRRVRTGSPPAIRRPHGTYLLATSGGGGDGAPLTEQVLAAYRTGRPDLARLLLILGPLMPSGLRADFFGQAHELDNVDAIEFDNSIENLIDGAAGVVGMCGYNTFCEVLSFNKPALIVPRTQPRQEQLIRAQRAKELGLVDMMLPEEACDPDALADRLARLPEMPLPYEAGAREMLNGLESISQFMNNWAANRPSANLYAIAGAG
jgi:predicted glycosyltransferase